VPQQLAGSHTGAESTSDWRSAICREDVDIVIVATTNQALVEISLEAAKAGKHIIVEKPAARKCRRT